MLHDVLAYRALVAGTFEYQCDAEDALKVKEAIDALPPRKTKRDQPAPVVPRLASSEVAHHHDDDHDDRLT